MPFLQDYYYQQLTMSPEEQIRLKMPTYFTEGVNFVYNLPVILPGRNDSGLIWVIGPGMYEIELVKQH